MPAVGADEKSVTGGAQVRGTNWDPTFPSVKFLHKGPKLYIGILSADKSVGQFGDSWEGDGIFMKIKDASGNENREVKLYFNANSRGGTPSADSAVYEPGGGMKATAAFGVGLANTGTVVYDTTQTDNGYTMELVVHLDTLGFSPTIDSARVLINIFDPDGYHKGAKPWEGPDSRAYYKSWWGSEWGPVMRTVRFGPATAVEQAETSVPIVFALAQNYPNPFNPTTTVRFDVPQLSQVDITVYDVMGREIRSLVRGDYAPGSYRIAFDATGLASGVYFYRMRSTAVEGGQVFVDTKKLVLVR
jgi:hypothetical protein